MKKYDQIFLRKDDEKEALKECYKVRWRHSPLSKAFLNSRPLRTSCPCRMVLTYHLTWFATDGLTMSLLKLVDLWIPKAHLVCESTRNCTLCCAGDSRIQASSALERRAETLMFRTESVRIRSEFPLSKLGNFQDQDGILWSKGRLDSSAKFKCEDVEMDLPF